MSHLLSLNNVSVTYGDNIIFSDISFHVHEDDRIGIIGANGIGKSTLLRLMTGREVADTGTVSLNKALKIGMVEQSPVYPSEQSVEEVLLAKMESLKSETSADEVEKEVRASVILDKLGFANTEQKVGELSGGWIKRLALALAMVEDPELLLLDEPTNHLDLKGILWLEQFLRNSPRACVLISHDRAFLEATCSKIIELNRAYPKGMLISEGGYSRFLQRKSEFQTVQAKTVESLANKVRNEIEWLKRGPKARTSKDKGRIEQANRMIDELSEIREKSKNRQADIDFNASGRKTKRLLVATGLSKTMGSLLFEELNILLKPGSRIGLIGGNGSGKTTLLKILAGKIEADEGEIKRADNLNIVYFDQQRETLDQSLSLSKSLCEDGDSVIFKGRPIHVASWARRFGFDTRQLETPLSRLSGGEQAKVLIARLMLIPADLLLLDEPTNDLDLPTLEILERNLAEFPGAIVLVTHDRYMLDQLSTAMLGLDGEGGHVWIAGYEQWQKHLKEQKSIGRAEQSEKKKARKKQKRSGGLNYYEKKEYALLEDSILQAEEAMQNAKSKYEDPAIASDSAKLDEAYKNFEDAKNEVDRLYQRWEELEAKL